MTLHRETVIACAEIAEKIERSDGSVNGRRAALEISSRIRALPTSPGWQDIASAPKEAAQLMLGIVRKGVLEEIHIGGYRYALNDDEVSWWWSDQADDEICPTHWQLLLPPPLSSPKVDETS